MMNKCPCIQNGCSIPECFSCNSCCNVFNLKFSSCCEKLQCHCQVPPYCSSACNACACPYRFAKKCLLSCIPKEREKPVNKKNNNHTEENTDGQPQQQRIDRDDENLAIFSEVENEANLWNQRRSDIASSLLVHTAEENTIKTNYNDTDRTVVRRTRSIIHSLKSILHNKTCPICSKQFKPEDTVCSSKLKKCKHRFHLECLCDWLIDNNDCPICRKSISLQSDVFSSSSSGSSTYISASSEAQPEIVLSKETEPESDSMLDSIKTFLESSKEKLLTSKNIVRILPSQSTTEEPEKQNVVLMEDETTQNIQQGINKNSVLNVMKKYFSSSKNITSSDINEIKLAPYHLMVEKDKHPINVLPKSDSQ